MLLVLHQGAIGDFLLTLSVMEPVARFLQAEHVVVIASAASAPVAAGRSVVMSVWSPESVGLHTLFGEGPLNAWLRSLIAGARWVVNFLDGPQTELHERLQDAATGRVVSVDPRPTPQTLAEHRHVTSQWAAAIREQGWDIGEPRAVVLSGCERSDAPTGVIIHPGSGGREKCWPLENFFAIGDRFAGNEVAWLLGPAECERSAGDCARIRTRAGERGEEVFIHDDLMRVANRMAAAGLYIGNDSGITHLAAATGVPTVAVFGPTDPCVWRPLGTHVTVLAPGQAGGTVAVTEVAAAIKAQRAGRLP